MLEEFFGNDEPGEDEQEGGIDGVAGDDGLLHPIAGTKRGDAGRGEEQEEDAPGDEGVPADVATARLPNEEDD